MAALAALLATAPAGASFRPVGGNLNVDPAKGTWGADLTSIGGTPYVAFNDNLNDPGTEPVRVRRLNGGSWDFVGGDVASTGSPSFAKIAGVGGAPWVAYTLFNQSTSGYQLFASSFNGSSWTSSGALNADASHTVFALDAGTLNPGGSERLLVAWAESTGSSDSKTHVRWRRSAGGGTFVWEQLGSSFQSNAGWQATAPDVVADGGTPYVAYLEVEPVVSGSPRYRVYVRRGNSGNTASAWTWTALGGQLNQNDLGATSPSLAIVGGEPWAAWAEKVGPAYRARVARYTGGSWLPVGSSDLDVDPTRDVSGVRVANVSGTAYVAFDQDTDGLLIGGRTFVKRFDGTRWVTVGGPLNLDPAAGATSQAIGAVGGVPYVAFNQWGTSFSVKSQLRVSRLEAPTCASSTVDVPHNALAHPVTLSCDEGVRRIVTGPGRGVLTELDGAGGTVKYTPAGGTSGPDSFTFLTSDGASDSNTATVTLNVAGPGGGGGGGGGDPVVGPSLSALRRTHAVFRVGLARTPPTGRAAAAPRRRRPLPRGTTFSFRLNQVAEVTMLVRRVRPGRRAGRRCLAPTRANRTRPRCLRLVTVATLKRDARAGLNRIPFSGRVGRRVLAPGAYRAVFHATNLLGRSPGRTSGFTIVR